MMPTLNRPLALAEKELKMFFRDLQMLFFSLALPLVLLLLMTVAFGGQSQFNATAHIMNLDDGPLGAELIERLEEAPGVTVDLLDPDRAQQLLEDSKIVNLIVIKESFSQRLSEGQAPEILIRHRGTGSTEGQIVNSHVAGIVREMLGENLMAQQVGAMLASTGSQISAAEVRDRVAELFAKARENPLIRVEEEAIGARPEPVAQFLPGIVTMFTLFAISLTAVSLVEERRKGTLERLLTTTLSRAELLSGTWLGNFGRGIIQVVFLFGLAWLLFGLFTPASFVSILLFGTVAVASVAGIGLVIAAISRTPEQANWIAVFFTMIMTTLGGSFFDTSGLTGVMAVLTRMTYNFWANDGFRRIILKGDALTSGPMVTNMAVLAAIGLGGWALALALFRLRGDAR